MPEPGDYRQQQELDEEEQFLLEEETFRDYYRGWLKHRQQQQNDVYQKELDDERPAWLKDLD